MTKAELLEQFVNATAELCRDRQEIVQAFRGVLKDEEIPSDGTVLSILSEIVASIQTNFSALSAVVDNLERGRPYSVAIPQIRTIIAQLATATWNELHRVPINKSHALVPVSVADHGKKASLFLGPEHGEKERSKTSFPLLEIGPAMLAQQSSFNFAHEFTDLANIVGSASTTSLRTSLATNADDCIGGVVEKARSVEQILTKLLSAAEESIEMRDIEDFSAIEPYNAILIVLRCKLSDQAATLAHLPKFFTAISEFNEHYHNFEFTAVKAQQLFAAILKLCLFAAQLVSSVQKCTEARFQHAEGIRDYLKAGLNDSDILIANFRTARNIPPSLWKMERI